MLRVSILIAALVAGGVARGEDTSIDWLFLLEADRFALSENTLVLTGLADATTTFSDRPHRLAARVPTAEFVALWNGADFANDPPNVGVTVRVDNRLVNAVVELSDGQLAGETLSFDVTLLEGEIPASGGEIMLFVDAFPTAVNSQITDAVTQANTTVLGVAPAVSTIGVYAPATGALANSPHNASTAQQQSSATSQAATMQGVSTLYSVGKPGQ